MKPRVLALDDERAAREAMSLRRILAEQAFSRAGGAPLVPGNTVRLLRDAKEQDSDYRNPHLRSEPVGNAFWLHRPGPGSPSLIQVSVRGRAEVALFGDDIKVCAPIRMNAGDYYLTVEEGDERATVSRISSKAGVKRQQCSLLLDDILKTMVELGAGYPDGGVRRLHCVPWDSATGLRWAEIVARLRKAGRAMPIKDSLIAATALTHDLTVATRNLSDFQPSGVQVLDPSRPQLPD